MLVPFFGALFTQKYGIFMEFWLSIFKKAQKVEVEILENIEHMYLQIR